MKWIESRVLWGSLLILGGFLFLLQNFGYIKFGDIFWVILLCLGGVFFLSIFFQSRESWWAVIPGFTLFSIAILIFLGTFAPDLIDNWEGSIVLGGIAISFLVIYLLNRENWWTIIPAGVLLTLSVIVGLEDAVQETVNISIFFLGLGITFALVAVTPNPQGSMSWAWIPAGIMVFMGLVFLIAVENLFLYLLPIGLIILGAIIIFRTFRG